MEIDILDGSDALIIAPAKPMIDWVNRVFPHNNTAYRDPMMHDHSSIYLIPEFDHHEDALKWLESNFKEIFIEELTGWCTDESTFPPLT